MKFKIFYLLLCFNSFLSAQEIESKAINENLDNYSIRETQEDTATFHGKVYSIKKYRNFENRDKNSTFKIIDGEKFILESFTKYRKDKKRIYREDFTNENSQITKYYFNKTDDLILKENKYAAKNINEHYFSWLFYNENGTLNENIEIKKNNNKFNFVQYLNYQYKDSIQLKKVTIKSIDYDSISSPLKTYIFTKNELIKKIPTYQSKIQKLKNFHGQYLPLEINDYVIEGRNVFFTYNKDNKITSEIWYDKDGLEDKTEFSYNSTNTEQIETKYMYKGREEFSKTTRRFDKFGNIVFDQVKYYDGSVGSINEYEYLYDPQGNWIEKKSFYTEINKGIADRKKLLATEIREINYYSDATTLDRFELPTLPQIIEDIRKNITDVAKINDDFLKEKRNAIEKESYDAEITTKEANEIEKFTPKYWELKQKAFGNLDEDDIEEAVAVYQMPSNDREDATQVLAIFKKNEKNLWVLKKQTSNPVLSSQSGGMMGNPFNGISISKKSIIIKHFGGSRDKWEYVHRYRFQNDNWYLIGASVNFGAPCDELVKFDYNLSTGDATYKKSIENCKNGIITTLKNEKTNLKIPLPKMDDFLPGENDFKFPNVKDNIYY